MGRGQFLEAVANDEDAAVPFHRPRRGRERQEDRDRHHQGAPDRAAQQSHRPLCSAHGRRARLAPLLAAAIALLALALPGCGSEAPAASQPAGSTTTGSTRTHAEVQGAPAGKPTASATCSAQLSGFLDQLEHLRRSLVIGVSYEQYVSELGTVRRSYEQIPVGELGLACVAGAANNAEQSFDGYLAAANAWGDCVSERGCETSALEPELRRKWRLAASHLADARNALVG